MKMTLATLGLALALATPVLANPPISENPYITERLIAGRVADRVRNECPAIGGRVVKALSELHKLKNWALDQGYSADEIRAFLDNGAEKDKLKARADAYIAKSGGKDQAGMCALGRKEIESGSIAGSLLYVK